MQFYGLGWNEVLSMESRWFFKLYQRISVIEARRLLPWLHVLAYPQIAAKKDRQRIVSDLEARAGYKQIKRLVGTSPQAHEDGWSKLRQMGIPHDPVTKGSHAER